MTQERALEILKLGHSVFLTGEAGSGKSYTVGQFIKWMEAQGMAYAVTASTGIAASHIDGQTIHSWAAIGIDRNLTDAQIDKAAGRSWERAHNVKALILDEISMVDAVLLEDLDKILQKVHRNTRVFGGVQVVFVGDFFQLPPVGRRDDPEPPRFAFESSAWERAGLVVCYLTEQHRQSTGDGIMEVLTAMRHGNITETERELVRGCVKNTPSETRLYTHNADVDTLNNQELAKIKGKEKKFEMREEGSEYMIATLKRQCLSPEVLKLKVGARVMFTSQQCEARIRQRDNRYCASVQRRLADRRDARRLRSLSGNCRVEYQAVEGRFRRAAGRGFRQADPASPRMGDHRPQIAGHVARLGVH
jgi:ATP-dependent DNA helicase PIF1